MIERLYQLTRLSRPQKRAVQVVADTLLIIVCFCTAMWLRLEHWVFLTNGAVWAVIAATAVATIVVFIRLGLYRSIVRYITLKALFFIATGVAFSGAFSFILDQVLNTPVPRSVPFIYAALLFISVGGLRFMMRGLLRKQIAIQRSPVLIYGAGDSGRQLANALVHGREYVAAGFIDDDETLWGNLVAGQLVHKPVGLERLIKKSGIKAILLAVPSASRLRRREIIESLQRIGVEIRTMPGIADIIDGRASFSDLKTVSPEDLLGRDPVPPREDLMSRNISGKTVLISGAGGSIGSELCRQIIRQSPAGLILLEVSEFALYTIATELRETLSTLNLSIPIEPILGSVQNPGRVKAVLKAFQVQTVYHAAAYKHVVLVEENVVEGIRNNVIGTKVIAEASAETGVENFILISTDKAVRPTNFMGASKRMAELVCQALAEEQSTTLFSMVRFGNVLGSSGSVIPRFKAQIESGGPVTVTHKDITRYFMTIPEAAQLVIQAGAMAEGGDVFVLDMGEPVKILNLAQSMIRLHGLKPYLADSTRNSVEGGDIEIKIVGLNKGEKLYEELLIGNDPKPTQCPRIMTATEVRLNKAELDRLIEDILSACLAFDISELRKLFLAAPLAYQPNNDDLHDLMWRVG
jgi:FlaA1/EpsC-like NDP-sugar epimerase